MSISDIDIDAEDLRITTTGDDMSAVSAEHKGTGNIAITTNGSNDPNSVNLTTNGFLSSGIRARHDGTGNIDISDTGSNIVTGGAFSYGIYAEHRGTGQITVEVDSAFIKSTAAPTPDPHGRRVAEAVGEAVAPSPGAHGFGSLCRHKKTVSCGTAPASPSVYQKTHP